MIDVNECFRKGLLKKGEKSKNLAKKSIKQAEYFLDEAQDLLNMDKRPIAVISLYNPYFHVSRALLFLDGIKERSHYCIARYIEDRYVNASKLDVNFLNNFEIMMGLRHTVQYSTEKTEVDEDVEGLYNVCQGYIKKVEGMINE